MKSLAVIVVDYKTIDKTISYLKMLADMFTDVDLIHAIIIDNGEEDKSEQINDELQYIEDMKLEERIIKHFWFKNMDVFYCFANENLGYGKGNNLGFKIIESFYADSIFLISNNDIKLTEKLSMNLIENIFNSDNSIAAIGPNIVGLKGEKQNPYFKPSVFRCAVLMITFIHNLFKVNIDIDYICKNDYCYRLMGSFIFLKSDYFKEVGGFDEKIFMYSEEPILSEKLLEKNLHCYYLDDYKVIHEHGATVKNSISKIQEKKLVFESLIYYLKEYRNVSDFRITLSRWHFNVYLFLYNVIYRFLRE